MTLKEQFEKLHPVPEGIDASGPEYRASWGLIGDIGLDAAGEVLGAYLEKFDIFQFGHAAGLERAEIAVDNTNSGDSDSCCITSLRVAADAIRAMKEPK